MDEQQSEPLFCVRRFPPVIHPRHARELLAAHPEDALAEWVGGYSITLPEHRQMLEDLLASLSWDTHGQAVLIQGLYGAGKSHLLVLLHLLAALPAAWPPFLETHPLFRRYARAMPGRHRLVIHCSLDEYAPQHALERTLQHEVVRALEQAGLPAPAAWQSAFSRRDAWSTLLAHCREHGYDGLILLIDELSLFLAGKTPAVREGDAAFLQFLADLAGRMPVWLIGALQRNLSDVGALRTHSWRQVEDRFRRYTLSPQEIGNMLRDKLIERRDPTAIRTVVATQLAPAGNALSLPLSAGELQLHWPFHPAALDLLTAVANSHLSPHRSVVEVLQRIEQTDWPQRAGNRLITPLDLFTLIREDLRNDERLRPLWRAVTLLAQYADNELAQQCLQLLTLLHLADRRESVARLRTLLFDGVSAPAVEEISRTLHALRRRGAYLSVTRDATAGEEVFSLAVDDETGALALARMQEVCQGLAGDDPRIMESVMLACREADWPFASAMQGITLPVAWHGEHPVQIVFSPFPAVEEIVRHYQGLLAGQADGCVLFVPPGSMTAWHSAVTMLEGPQTAVFLCWQPRPLNDHEQALWTEFAAWQRAADIPATTPGEKRVSRCCQERADELRAGVVTSVMDSYLAGQWHAASGAQGQPSPGASLAQALAPLFAAGFSHLFPLAPALAANGAPPPAVCQQLLQHFFLPGAMNLATQSLLAEYIERFAVPLGCVSVTGNNAAVIPPRREIVEMLLAATAGPVRVAHLMPVMRQPPLGLPVETARLALAAALRSGVVHGLDAFLQPIDLESLTVPLLDAVVFVAAPTPVPDEYRPQVIALAACWQIPPEPWPAACSQVEQRLRAWLADWRQRLPVIRDALADWSNVLQVLPWGWRACEELLTRLEELGRQESLTLPLMLDALTVPLNRFEQCWETARWWQSRRPQLVLLPQLSLPEALAQEAASIRGLLTAGEEAFPTLPAIGERLDTVMAAYRDAYRTWHEQVFGAETIAALRAVFDSSEFRAIKALSRLPLPLPESAERCLAALAQARTQYCPGAFAQLEIDGCCLHCRLPLHSDSPMPEAGRIRALADEGVREYAALLVAHPWAAEMRRQLPRAPETVAERGRALLNWQGETGSVALVELLDEPLLAWLCRDHHVSGVRRVSDMRERLSGRDLTIEEAAHAVRDWLDPEHALPDDALLSFE